ncbi:ATP-binding protein [Myxococcota bacterium]|nr:ATP-binding protein [Myxococcota bacterium]
MDRDRSPSFLLVDDNADFSTATSGLLAQLFPGARVEVAATGTEALRALSDGGAAFDAVLLDYRLPDLDGLGVLAEMRNRGVDTAVVMVTGGGDELVAADMFRMGAYDYLVKSRIDRHLLRRTLDSVLERRRLEGEVRAKSDVLAQRSLELDEKNRALEAAYNLLRTRKELLTQLSEDLERQVNVRTAELRRTTDFLNRVLDAAADHFIIATDARGRVLTFNRGARRIFGWADEDVIGRLGLGELLRFDDGADLSALLERVRSAGEFRAELTGARRDGALFPCRADFSPLPGEDDGAPSSGVVVLGTDITTERAMAEQLRSYTRSLEHANRELRRQFEEIQEATRLKSEFIANISHELRTPLNAVIGYADLLRGKVYGELNTKQDKAVSGIHERANDLLRLINDILDLSRIEAGRLSLTREAFDLREVVDEVADLGRVLAQGKSVTVQGLVEPGLPGVQTDRQKLKQILFNLVTNAVKFTTQGRIVLCAGAGRPGWFRVDVTDTGIGIGHEDQAVIFDAFRQLDGTDARRYGGTGLGLNISRAFARYLGGELTVTSTPGAGSTFSVELPCVAPEPETTASPARAGQDPGHPQPARA